MVNFEQTRMGAINYQRQRRKIGEAMSGVAKCRKRAQEILAQAERDPRHSRKIIARDKKEPMAQSDWYHHRAAECDRMALASRSPVARSRHITDRDRWREIAASIDVAEEAVKQKKKREREQARLT